MHGPGVELLLHLCAVVLGVLAGRALLKLIAT